VFLRNDGSLFAGLHGVISQKTELFITTAVRTGDFTFRSSVIFHLRNLNLVALVALPSHSFVRRVQSPAGPPHPPVY
jgi:hypothetical protein